MAAVAADEAAAEYRPEEAEDRSPPSRLRFSGGSVLTGMECTGTGSSLCKLPFTSTSRRLVVWYRGTWYSCTAQPVAVRYFWVGLPTFLGLFIGTTFARAP